MTKREQIEEELTKAMQSIDMALRDLREAERFARQAGNSRFAEEIRSYTIGNIGAFTDDGDFGNTHQMGNIPNLIKSLDEEFPEEPAEDEDEDERPGPDDPHGPDCAMRLHSAAECTCGKADRQNESE